MFYFFLCGKGENLLENYTYTLHIPSLTKIPVSTQFYPFRTDFDFRMVVLPPLRDVLHRAGLAEPHLAVAGRRRPAGECRQRAGRRTGVQGLAQPA